jgi:hypothetical protein
MRTDFGWTLIRSTYPANGPRVNHVGSGYRAMCGKVFAHPFLTRTFSGETHEITCKKCQRRCERLWPEVELWPWSSVLVVVSD